MGVTADSGIRLASETCWFADGFDGCAVVLPTGGGADPTDIFRPEPRPDDDEVILLVIKTFLDSR